jgi:hypothetical protein
MSGEKYRILRDQQRERAEVPVPLIKGADRPVMPPIDRIPGASDPAADE